mgnify:CR=1 FL=1
MESTRERRSLFDTHVHIQREREKLGWRNTRTKKRQRRRADGIQREEKGGEGVYD